MLLDRLSVQGKALLLSAVLSVGCAYAKAPPLPSKKYPPAVKKQTQPAITISPHTQPYHKASVVTLLDAFEQALNTNPAILQSIANEQAAQHNLSETRAGYYPTVAANYSLGHNHSVVPNANYIDSFVQTRSITATQLLFDGGSLSNQVGVADAQLEESAELTKGEVNTLAIDTVEAYLDYLRDTHLLALAKKNLNSHYHTLKSIKKRFEGGALRVSEYELSRSRVAQAQTVLYTNQRDLDVVRSDYIRIVGRPPQELVAPTFDKQALPKSLDEAQILAKKKNPSIDVARKQLKSAVSSLAEAKSSAYSPQVNLELSASRDRNAGGLQGVSADMQGLVSASYTLLDGGADIDAIRKAAALKVASEQNLADIKRIVRNQLQQDWLDMIASQKRGKAYRNRVASGKIVLRSYRKQFMIGKVSLLNVLDVENQLFVSETAMVENEYALQTAYYRILSDIGVLPQYFAKEFSKKYTNA